MKIDWKKICIRLAWWVSPFFLFNTELSADPIKLDDLHAYIISVKEQGLTVRQFIESTAHQAKFLSLLQSFYGGPENYPPESHTKLLQQIGLGLSSVDDLAAALWNRKLNVDPPLIFESNIRSFAKVLRPSAWNEYWRAKLNFLLSTRALFSEKSEAAVENSIRQAFFNARREASLFEQKLKEENAVFQKQVNQDLREFVNGQKDQRRQFYEKEIRKWVPQLMIVVPTILFRSLTADKLEQVNSGNADLILDTFTDVRQTFLGLFKPYVEANESFPPVFPLSSMNSFPTLKCWPQIQLCLKIKCGGPRAARSRSMQED